MKNGSETSVLNPRLILHHNVNNLLYTASGKLTFHLFVLDYTDEPSSFGSWEKRKRLAHLTSDSWVLLLHLMSMCKRVRQGFPTLTNTTVPRLRRAL